MSKIKYSFALLLFLFFSNSFAANYCSDLIYDETGSIESAKSAQLETAANKLVQQGVDVKVRILKDLKGFQSLAALKNSALEKCGSWKGGSSGMKNNLMVFYYVPSAGKMAWFYGDSLISKFDPLEKQVQNVMAGMFRDKLVADGFIAGLNSAADVNSIPLAQQNAKQLVINQAADNSQAWSLLGWIVSIFVAFILFWVLTIVLSNRAKKRKAQVSAKTQRARCTTAINSFDEKYAILKAKLNKLESEKRKGDLLARMLKVRSNFDLYSANLDSLIRGGNDTDNPKLSADEYEQMSVHFYELARKFEALFDIMNDIERDSLRNEETEVKIDTDYTAGKSGFAEQVSKVEPEKPVENRQGQHGGTSTTQNYSSGRNDPPVVHHTTVIHERDSGSDFTTGLVLGSILADDDREVHHHHHYDDNGDANRQPDYGHHSNNDEQQNTSGGGEEIDLGESTKGGGSEIDLGVSSNGGGSERSIFDEPEEDDSKGGSESSIFSRDPEPEPEPEPEEAPDFGSSSSNDDDDDSKPADSNCDCDCDCDCNCDSSND